MDYVSFNTGLWGKARLVETVMVIDREPEWITACDALVSSLGYQCLTVTDLPQALARLDEFDVSTVIVDHDTPNGDGFAFVEQLGEAARRNGRALRFIMTTRHATLDIAVRAIRASVVDLLEKPVSCDQLQKALLRAHGIDLEGPARTALVSHLSSLSEEMRRISALIGGSGDAHAPNVAPQTNEPTPVTPDFIRRMLRTEAKRRKLGNGMLFGDPAWDMLLDLMIAKLQGNKVPVSSACIASGAPTTTALRLINRLVGESILRRVPDDRDGRRDFLEIDPAIEEQLMAYLRELAKVE